MKTIVGVISRKEIELLVKNFEFYRNNFLHYWLKGAKYFRRANELKDKLWDAEQEISDLKYDLERETDANDQATDAWEAYTRTLLDQQHQYQERIFQLNTALEQQRASALESFKQQDELIDALIEHAQELETEAVESDKAFRLRTALTITLLNDVADLKYKITVLQQTPAMIIQVMAIADQIKPDDVVNAGTEPNEFVPPACLKPLDALKFNEMVIFGNATTQGQS